MEISSPPYPRKSVNPRELCQALGELYQWVEDQRTWAEEIAVKLHAPERPYLPPIISKEVTQNFDRFITLSVTDMFSSWTVLRQIRESYDEVIRNYEDDWSSDTCSFQRLAIIKAGAFLLAIAYLPHERREAKEMDFMAQTQSSINSILKLLEEHLDKNKDNEEPLDFDKFFNGDNN